jgi:hypothetical protein
MPIAIPNGDLINQRYFFYEEVNDALQIWNPILPFEKSEIYLPAKGEYSNEYFKGSCMICDAHYADYLCHIGTQKHNKNLKKSKFNKDIQELCLKFKVK